MRIPDFISINDAITAIRVKQREYRRVREMASTADVVYVNNKLADGLQSVIDFLEHVCADQIAKGNKK